MADPESELLDLIAEHVPRRSRARLSPDATLRDVGIDSLGLVIIISHFLGRYPVPVNQLERQIAKVKTVRDLLDLGKEAVALLRNGHAT